MKREITSKLVDWKNSKHRKPLLLDGARQVGKTYVLKDFGKHHFTRCHYINFEENKALHAIFEKQLNPNHILRELSLHLKVEINPTADLLLFDEIQACPQAITSLKYFCEDLPLLAVCAAGSLLGVALSSAAFPVGKVDLLHMFPMSLAEFLQGTGEAKLADLLTHWRPNQDHSEYVHGQLWEQLKLYFIVGGLPEVVRHFSEHKNDLHTAFAAARALQGTLIQNYYRDVAKHSGKINALHIERVLTHIPAQLAKPQKSVPNKFVFKDVLPSDSRYAKLAGPIDWLVKAGLVIRVPIVNQAQQPLMAYAAENVFKLYVFDVGILGALCNLDPETIWHYDYSTYKGYFAENYVAQALLVSGITHLYAWNENTAELEFLVEHGSEVMPIEVKAGHQTRAKSLAVFAKKYQPRLQVVLSAKNTFFNRQISKFNGPLYVAGMLKFPND